jgi:hypothetical protein
MTTIGADLIPTIDTKRIAADLIPIMAATGTEADLRRLLALQVPTRLLHHHPRIRPSMPSQAVRVSVG